MGTGAPAPSKFGKHIVITRNEVNSLQFDREKELKFCIFRKNVKLGKRYWILFSKSVFE